MRLNAYNRASAYNPVSTVLWLVAWVGRSSIPVHYCHAHSLKFTAIQDIEWNKYSQVRTKLPWLHTPRSNHGSGGYMGAYPPRRCGISYTKLLLCPLRHSKYCTRWRNGFGHYIVPVQYLASFGTITTTRKQLLYTPYKSLWVDMTIIIWL